MKSTLGEFREATKNLPDDIYLNLSTSEIAPSHDGGGWYVEEDLSEGYVVISAVNE